MTLAAVQAISGLTSHIDLIKAAAYKTIPFGILTVAKNILAVSAGFR